MDALSHYILEQLVSWSLTSPSSTNMAISETKDQRWRAIPTQWRKASDILTSTLAAFLFSSHPNRERYREAHINYYARTYNRGRQLSHSFQNIIRSSAGASDYFLSVLWKLFEPFMRYRGNNIWPDKQTNERMDVWTTGLPKTWCMYRQCRVPKAQKYKHQTVINGLTTTTTTTKTTVL